jgi:SAM-dependent methyltransferase
MKKVVLQTFYFNPDVILRFKAGSWIISNPRVRTHVELGKKGIEAFLSACGKTGATKEKWSLSLHSCKGRDRTQRFTGENGLVADHSCFLGRDDGDEWVAADGLFNLLRKTGILIKSREESLAHVCELTGLLDRDNLGTFHQRVGQYLLLGRRSKEPWREWQNQKFTEDGSTLLDTPYRKLQEPFFDTYFSADRVKGLRVLDFGCGNAYYTSKFAERGANVIGLDNSSELLEIAQRNHSDKQKMQLILASSFDEVIDLMLTWDQGSFDLVYLQDTLLLLLQPETGIPSKRLPDLFAGFRRLLNSQGTLCAMEPNPIFWLANRYGDASSSYAVVTEYKNSVFNVAPTIDRLLPVMAKAGFALKDFQHPYPSLEGSSGRDSYYSEFPIWDFFVFIPV